MAGPACSSTSTTSLQSWDAIDCCDGVPTSPEAIAASAERFSLDAFLASLLSVLADTQASATPGRG